MAEDDSSSLLVAFPPAAGGHGSDANLQHARQGPKAPKQDSGKADSRQSGLAELGKHQRVDEKNEGVE
jgi:hypothetical protein